MSKTCIFLYAAALAAFAGCVTTTRPSAETIVAALGEPTESPATSLATFSLAVDRGFAFSCEVSMVEGGRLMARGDDGRSAEEGGSAAPAPIEEVLPLARPGRRICLVVKPETGSVPLVKAALSAFPQAKPDAVLLESADANVCVALKDVLPDYDVLLLSKAIPAADLVSAAVAAKADGVDVTFDGDVVTEEYVKFVKDSGLSLRIHGVNELPQLLRAFAVGADAVSVRGAKRLFDEYTALYAPEPETRDVFSDRIIDGAAFPTGI